MLATAAALPVAIMSGVAVVALLGQQRQQADSAAANLTRAYTAAVDAELARSRSTLAALATSPLLDDASHLREFHALAHRVDEVMTSQWLTVILATPDGRMVVNDTLAASPQGPSELVERSSFDEVVRTQQSVVGRMAKGPTGTWGVPLRLPVLRKGELRYVLTAVLKPETLQAVLVRQPVPEDWLVSVFDGNGVRVARSRNHDESMGMPGSPSLVQLMKNSPAQGAGFALTTEGVPARVTYIRSPQTGWTVVIGRPARAFEAETQHSLVIYGGGVLISLIAGVVLSLAIARSINRPIADLGDAARALGAGLKPSVPKSDIREIRAVAQALAMSAEQRDANEAEREALLTAARLAHERLELVASASSALSTSLDPHTVLEAIGAILVPGMCDWCRIDLIDSEGRQHRALTRHADPSKRALGEAISAKAVGSVSTPGAMAWIIATGQSHHGDFETPEDVDARGDPALSAFVKAAGVRSYAMVPLLARGRCIGALAALQAESGRRFTDDDRALIGELAHRAAMAIDNARLYADAQMARQQAESANRVKDEFLAMLGHELRNPLAPIVTALDVMASRDGAHKSREHAIIERQVAHLSRLVDDLLDVSRITQGKITLQQERVDMKAVVARAVELAQPPGPNAHGRPIRVAQPDGPVFVQGDAVRLAQVLCNLLLNALKFTPPEGRVTLTLTQRDGVIECVVEDTGRGIEPALLPHVFDVFVQGQQLLDRNTGGLGLGLAIVKTLVEMHQGSVSAYSEGAGQGSRFTVRLPALDASAVPAPSAQPAHQASDARGRILVVDDNLDAADMLGTLLQATGHEVRIATDGPSALASLDDFHPEVAVLDIGLPGMDGYELARRLRQDPRSAQARLIALTGYGTQADRARALAAEFDEHLVKPVQADTLLETVRGMLQPRHHS